MDYHFYWNLRSWGMMLIDMWTLSVPQRRHWWSLFSGNRQTVQSVSSSKGAEYPAHIICFWQHAIFPEVNPRFSLWVLMKSFCGDDAGWGGALDMSSNQWREKAGGFFSSSSEWTHPPPPCILRRKILNKNAHKTLKKVATVVGAVVTGWVKITLNWGIDQHWQLKLNDKALLIMLLVGLIS